jgi:hypothetical protein
MICVLSNSMDYTVFDLSNFNHEGKIGMFN